MYRFELPDIGEGVVEAEVIEWKVAEGDRLELDQVFVELLTDKASIEIPAPWAGIVHRLCYAEGDIVPVGAVLIEIEGSGAAATEPKSEAARVPPAEPQIEAPIPFSSTPADQASKPGGAPSNPPVMPARPGPRGQAAEAGAVVRAVPAVRELAKRLGVDLALVQASGPGGRVMRRDVQRHAESTESARSGAKPTRAAETDPAAAQADSVHSEDEAPYGVERSDPEDWERIPLRGLRRAIAKHMSESRRRAAHFSYVEELDISELLRKRDRAQQDQNLEILSLLAFIARATLRALPGFPMLSASIDDARQEIVLKKTVHLGVAVATSDALVVPVIRNAARLSTIGLAHEIALLAQRARDGELSPNELRGSTFTITSLGKLGGVASTPILNHPESGILAINAVRELPRYVEGALQPRSIMNLSISVDHRIADGFVAASFVQELKRILEAADFPDLFSA
jgi:pyruvate dehydrogenase E2 component (dihydrolipoamide acetyltransferase)